MIDRPDPPETDEHQWVCTVLTINEDGENVILDIVCDDHEDAVNVSHDVWGDRWAAYPPTSFETLEALLSVHHDTVYVHIDDDIDADPFDQED